MEDSKIVELYFERSEEAIRETSGKYGVYLKHIAYNILRDLSDTEEIVSDTYLGAWRAIPPTRPDSLKHFLSRITRNLSYNRLDYKNADRRCAEWAELDECIPDAHGSVERTLEAKELGGLLNGFLAKLDRRSCALFLARYYYAQTLSEVAARYALTERQAKYKLSKLRDELRTYLEKEGVVL